MVCLLVGAFACRSESPDAPEAPSEADQGPPRQVVRPPVPATSEATLEAVRACLGWELAAPVCRSGSDVVAFGLGEAIDNPSLSRMSAAARARAELARQLGHATPTVRLRGSRVPRVLSCEGRSLGIAVLRGEVGAEPCPASLGSLASSPEGDPCPPWIRGFGEETERGYLGVGAASGLSNPALAEQTARHRAVSNALSVRETRLKGDALLRVGPRPPTRLLSTRSARCDDTTFVEVEVQVETEGEAATP